MRYIFELEVTPTDTNDIIAIIAASGRRVSLAELRITGAGTTSALQGCKVARSSAGVTPGGLIVPSFMDNQDQRDASDWFTVAGSWVTKPTLEANGYLMGWNSFGGNAQIGHPDADMLEARNGGSISVRAGAINATPFQSCRLTAVVFVK